MKERPGSVFGGDAGESKYRDLWGPARFRLAVCLTRRARYSRRTVNFDDEPFYLGSTPAGRGIPFVHGGDVPDGYSEFGSGDRQVVWLAWARKFDDFLVGAQKKELLEEVTPQIKLEDADATGPIAAARGRPCADANGGDSECVRLRAGPADVCRQCRFHGHPDRAIARFGGECARDHARGARREARLSSSRRLQTRRQQNGMELDRLGPATTSASKTGFRPISNRRSCNGSTASISNSRSTPRP